MTPDRELVQSAQALAQTLPSQMIEALADAISTHNGISLNAEIVKRMPHHEHRNLALSFIDHWMKGPKEMDARTITVALLSAEQAERRIRESQAVEVAWTGPEVDTTPFRRTEQAILQVLDGAKSRITLVSFAVYRIPNIARSLVGAAKRGVRLTIILETPDRIIGKDEFSTIQALGTDVADCSSVYYWPKENRPLSETNKPGLLHVKCIVADGKSLFLSSANLTQQAFTINMELGLILRGSSVPAMIESHFGDLIRTGQLKPL